MADIGDGCQGQGKKMGGSVGDCGGWWAIMRPQPSYE